MNHYEVLGVPPASDAGEVRKAYLEAARACHPDFHVDADEETRAANARRMQQVNAAWEVLGDPGARIMYDRSLGRSSDPGVARRAAREPDVPAGKGWTPRADDTGWMDDFEGWASERDHLAPEPSAVRSFATVLPVLLLVLGVVCLFLGAVVKLSALLAFGAICAILAAGLFLLLPMFEMSRGRRR